MTTPALPRLRSALTAFALFISIVVASVAAQSSGTAAAPLWADGSIQYSVITNCVSIIQGNPYQEYGAGTYVGYLANTATAEPYPGETYYIHVVVYGLGNACSGQRADINFTLPANTSLAITATNKVYCFAGGVLDTADCPQTLQSSSGLYGSGSIRVPSPDSANANTWPLPQGGNWEFQVPVVSATSLTGSQLVGHTKMFDGNSSPVLVPTAGVTVFSKAPTVTYPNPSTSVGAGTWPVALSSSASITPYGVAGSFYFDMLTGSGGSVAFTDAPSSIPAGTTGTVGVVVVVVVVGVVVVVLVVVVTGAAGVWNDCWAPV